MSTSAPSFASSAGGPRGGPGPGGIRLLLVDDHEIVREALRLRLEREPDFTVAGGAASAEEACAAVERLRPHVVLMDVGLPGEDGIAATARVRQAAPETRVLMLSGSVEPDVVLRAIRAGAAGFLRKSDGLGELVQAVRLVAEGQAYLSPEATRVLMETLRAPGGGLAPAGDAGPLGERDVAFLRGVGAGLSYKEIAARLGVSVKAVDADRARLARKLGCATRAEMVRYAIRAGLVQP